ncbi:ABC transporter substrate-binding protein [Actinospica sp. MGRD01-02]|uniref:ABC transporter substrate-binding protein n=1 Tax=Actinospica acidithermotolerans TaxID=2828514 RepID=A0A941E9H9_9ACTN|nr:ABC transporter substrate-binding protein [Actinospica acidithermotolerans]MBR7826312.1 ABC transporter substrate-binding protein [Actinospica acidithermotolerans]
MSSKSFIRFAVPAAAILAASALAGCSSSTSSSGSPLAPKTSSGSVVVGSDNFSESVLLADIYGQALAAKGVKVSYNLNIGSREVTYNLVKSGSLTLKPEYNGALLSYLNKSATQTSTSEVDSAISAKLPSNLEILNPSSAQDNDTLTLSKQEASSLGLSSSATITGFVGKLGGKSITVGGSPEFQTRTQGLLGLENVYGLKSSQVTYKTLDAGGPLTEKALTSGQVDAGDLFTTDTTISQNGLLTLVDDKDIFGVQNVLPLVNKSALSQADISALDAVDAKLDSATLLKLDTEVQVQKQDPLTVANDWLKSVGLS